MNDLIFIDKVSSNRNAFAEKVKDVATDLGIDPNWLMLIMNNESGITHNLVAKNGCTGLIMFCPNSGAKAVGKTTAQLAAMTNVEQLDYVQILFEKVMGTYFAEYDSFAQLYLACYLPAYVRKDDSFLIPKVYSSANPTFDYNKDGIQTIGEFKKAVNAKYEKDYPYLTKEGNPYFTSGENINFRLTRRRKRLLIVLLVLLLVGAGIAYYFGYFDKTLLVVADPNSR